MDNILKINQKYSKFLEKCYCLFLPLSGKEARCLTEKARASSPGRRRDSLWGARLIVESRASKACSAADYITKTRNTRYITPLQSTLDPINTNVHWLHHVLRVQNIKSTKWYQKKHNKYLYTQQILGLFRYITNVYGKNVITYWFNSSFTDSHHYVTVKQQIYNKSTINVKKMM